MSDSPVQLNALKFPMATGTAISCFVLLSTLIFSPTGGYVINNLGFGSLPNAQPLNAILSFLPLWAITVVILLFRNFRSGRAVARAAKARSSDGTAAELERQAVARVSDLATKLRIPTPKIVFDPIAAGACVVGIGRPWQLVLDIISLHALRRKPARFDAAVVHELAHVASGDAFRRALSEALLWAIYSLLIAWTIITAKIYILHVYGRVGGLPATPGYLRLLGFYSVIYGCGFIEHLIPAIFFILCVRVAYAYVLRRQEYVADWLGSVSGFGAGTMEYLSIQKSRKRSPLQRLFDLHPSPESRLAALKISPLDRIPAVESMLLGLLSAIYVAWLSDTFAAMFKTMAASGSFMGGLIALVHSGEFWMFFGLSLFYAYFISTAFMIFTPFALQNWVKNEGRWRAMRPILIGAGLCAVCFVSGIVIQPYFWARLYLSQINGQFHLYIPSVIVTIETIPSEIPTFIIFFLLFVVAGFTTRDSLRRPLRPFSTRVVVNALYFIIGCLLIANIIVALIVSPEVKNFLSSKGAPSWIISTPIIVAYFSATIGLIFALTALVRRFWLGRRNKTFAAWREDAHLVVQTPTN